MSPSSTPFQHVGIIGAGIGGLACALATRRHSKSNQNNNTNNNNNGSSSSSSSLGLRVTVLEAASELGEIGAGIQMTPNVARLLVRWGVADVIGDQLVAFERMYLRTKDGRIVGRTETPGPGAPERWAGAPWWLVHRMHLHEGLRIVAEREGVEIVTGARVVSITQQQQQQQEEDHGQGGEGGKGEGGVEVRDETGRTWRFDLVIGADGVKSFTRQTILPEVQPRPPPTHTAAYRAVVPMARLRADPLTADLVARPEMNVWMGASQPGTQGEEEEEGYGYVITYPISGGDVFNMVLTHLRAAPVRQVEDVSLAEVRRTYASYDARLRRMLELIPEEQCVRRWPLLVTRCPGRWSNADKKNKKNIVLLGDAAHSMVNHLAQGAATAMEDGAFLGVLLREVHRGRVGLTTALGAYEAARMPLADRKQQTSLLMGMVYHLEEGSAAQVARDAWMAGEVRGGQQLVRTPNLNADPHLWRTVFGYDPEAHAEQVVEELLTGTELRNPQSGVTREVADTYMNYWLPPESLGVKSLL